MIFDFDAYVTAVAFTREGPAFALGDGTVRMGAAEIAAHDGAILAAAVHPSGEGLVTGGDDGRLVWTRMAGARELATAPGRWIDAVATAPESGLIAFSAGRDLHVLDATDPAFHNLYSHEKSVSGLAFDPKGRRIAAATYGGAALWFARIAAQKPLLLKWAGSHVALSFSPDGKFLVSSMQENQLHGWRLADAKDMRMGGYPGKIKSLTFLAKGAAMATSGSAGAVVWPFGGASGPMGRQASEVGFEEGAMVTAVAAAPDLSLVAGGLADGRVWVMNIAKGKRVWIRAEKGEAVSALAMAANGSAIAWGCEDGAAGVAGTPSLD